MYLTEIEKNRFSQDKLGKGITNGMVAYTPALDSLKAKNEAARAATPRCTTRAWDCPCTHCYWYKHTYGVPCPETNE